jgi:hypothetical protein
MKKIILSLMLLCSLTSLTTQSIKKVEEFKYSVNANNRKVIITIYNYNFDKNVIYYGVINEDKIFDFTNLSNGKYKIEVKDLRKNVIDNKEFLINKKL